MFTSPNIKEFDPHLPGTHAFRITGKVDRDEMAQMSEYMLGAFEAPGKIDMLLVFAEGAGSEAGAAFSLDSLKARARSLSNVRNYVVAGAPQSANSVLEAMGALIPVNAETFPSETEALDWLRKQDNPS